MDILLHPFKRLDLIFQAIIQAGTLLNLFAGEKAVRPHPVVEGDHHDVVARCFDQAGAIIVGIGQLRKASSLDKKVDRQPLSGPNGVCWSINIDKQTIF